jgi:uncharacterized FlaG/YvyC family protein
LRIDPDLRTIADQAGDGLRGQKTSSPQTSELEVHPSVQVSDTTLTAITAPLSEKEVSVQWNEDRVMIIRFLDKRSGDVVGQIPSDEMLRVVHNIEQFLRQQAEEHRTQRG